MKTMFLAAVGAALLTIPATAQDQAPDIQHDPLGCVVAGKFPQVDACFTAADVARARVYFKGTAGAHWYWVDFKPAEKCFGATLPRPTKSLKQMMYYVEVVDRQHREMRTDDRTVDIVPDAGGCKKDLPVAGWVQNATVSVGVPAGAPVVPAGFVTSAVGGGIGAGTIVGGLAATSAAAYGGATLISDEGGEEATPSPSPTSTAVATAPPTPAPTPSPTPAPAPTASPTAPPQPFRASITISPTSGVEPLLVTFDGCASTGENLQFGYDYDGDGIDDQRGPCRVTRTYTLSGVTLASARRASLGGAAAADYRATMTVWERVSGGQSESQTVVIHVDAVKPTPAPCDGIGPTVSMVKPTGSVDEGAPLEANADDPNEVASVQFKAQNCSDGCFGTVEDIGTPSPVPGPGPTFSATWTGMPCGGSFTFYDVWAVAKDSCGATTTSGRVTVSIAKMCPFAPASGFGWTSDLKLEGGGGTLVLDDQARAVPAGVSFGEHAAVPGGHRVEFRLERGGRAGLWRFAPRDPAAWDPSTLHVLAGEIVSMGRDGIVFRLKGQPGESIRFTFE